MSVGDMWLVPETSSENAEYVWTGSAWEKMGVVSSVAHCTLTLKGAKFTVGETSTETSTFNNTQDVVLDLSGFATTDALGKLQTQVSDIDVNDGCLRIKWTTDSDIEEEDLFTANQANDVTLDLSKYPLTKDGIPAAWKTAIQSMIKEALTGYVYAESGGDLFRSEYNSTEDVVDLNPLEVNIDNGNITATAFYETN